MESLKFAENAVTDSSCFSRNCSGVIDLSWNSSANCESLTFWCFGVKIGFCGICWLENGVSLHQDGYSLSEQLRPQIEFVSNRRKRGRVWRTVLGKMASEYQLLKEPNFHLHEKWQQRWARKKCAAMHQAFAGSDVAAMAPSLAEWTNKGCS